MGGEIEVGKCDFCGKTKSLDRIYIHSNTCKEHNIIIRFCHDCGCKEADAINELDKLRKATKVEVHFDGAEVNEKLALRCEELRQRIETVVKECEHPHWQTWFNSEDHRQAMCWKDRILRAAQGMA